MSLSVTWHLASLSAKKVGGGVCLHSCYRQTSVDVPCRCCCLPLICWLLTWHSCVIQMVYQCVQVVVGGQWWCGDDGWASWVVVVVVVEEEGGCCLLTCLLTPKLSIGICRCSIWVVAMVHRIYQGHFIIFQWSLGAAVRVFSHSCT